MKTIDIFEALAEVSPSLPVSVYHEADVHIIQGPQGMQDIIRCRGNKRHAVCKIIKTCVDPNEGEVIIVLKEA